MEQITTYLSLIVFIVTVAVILWFVARNSGKKPQAVLIKRKPCTAEGSGDTDFTIFSLADVKETLLSVDLAEVSNSGAVPVIIKYIDEIAPSVRVFSLVARDTRKFIKLSGVVKGSLSSILSWIEWLRPRNVIYVIDDSRLCEKAMKDLPKAPIFQFSGEPIVVGSGECKWDISDIAAHYGIGKSRDGRGINFKVYVIDDNILVVLVFNQLSVGSTMWSGDVLLVAPE